MERKLYYACVAIDMVDYFDSKLQERADEIRVGMKLSWLTSDGTPCMLYLLQAEEGIIDPEYEITPEVERSL